MQTKNTPKIVPMEVDDSKILPMTDNLTEEDFLPSVEVVKEDKNAVGGRAPEGTYLVGDGSPEVHIPLQSVKPPVVLVKDQVVEFRDKTCRVVEVVDIDRFHLKNINQPFDSFIVTSSELE